MSEARMKQRPGIGKGAACGVTSCSGCPSSCSDAGRRGMLVLLLVLGLAAIPIYLLLASGGRP